MNVVLLHGKDKTPADIWYPWIKNELDKLGIACEVPVLPSTELPKINEWLEVLGSFHPGKDTVLIGHSRGGMAILRWLEKTNISVAKVILVAANSALIEDASKGDFYSGPYDFSAIRQRCDNFVVIHSKDDQWVPYKAALENTKGLDAKLINFEDKAHFGTQPNGSTMKTFPELLQEIITD